MSARLVALGAAAAVLAGCAHSRRSKKTLWRTEPCYDNPEHLQPCATPPPGSGSGSGSGSDSDSVSDSGSVSGSVSVSFDPRLFDRIAVLGASVSAGFSAPRVGAAFAAALPGASVTDAADLMMFRDPIAKGAAQIDAALAARPTLVVGVDFLFWYAYQDGDTAARQASLERGLAQLDRLPAELALAIGDLPDMRRADPRMLPPAVVPTPAELAAMNTRVHAWAAGRARTVVLSLAAWTAPLLDGGLVELAPGDAIAADRLLFLDHLHPNPLGLWYLLARVDGALEAATGAPPAALVFARP